MWNKLVVIFLCVTNFFSLVFAQPQTINTAPPRKLTHAEEEMLKAKTGKPFDVRRNCLRGNNLYSYKGQELYVFPYNQSNYYIFFTFITDDNTDYYNPCD